MSYILVIDDERSICDLLREVFTDAGYEVRVAHTGIEGLERIAEGVPDLVITDILMPDKEGLETIREIRAAHGALPIFAMSGGSLHGPLDVLGMARRFGAQRVFPKPFDPFEMLAAVREIRPAA